MAGTAPPALSADPVRRNNGLSGLNGFGAEHNPLNPFNPLFRPLLTEPGRR